MYVIVEIAGQQFKAEKGRKLYVHRLPGEENSSVSFDKVLLADNDGQVKVGAPVVEGASVKCKILKHLKDDKVLVFKKKRRTGYQKQNGHRQFLSQILVEEIVARTAASRKASDSVSNFSVVSSLKLATSSFAREVLSTIRART